MYNIKISRQQNTIRVQRVDRTFKLQHTGRRGPKGDPGDITNLPPPLTQIANLNPNENDIIQIKSGVWTNRSPSQFKTDLSLTAVDIANVPSGTVASTNIQDAINELANDIATIPPGYSDEQAQDAVGNILADSTEIDFSYNDVTPSISATVRAGSIDESKLDSSTNASLDLADSSLQPGDNISELVNDAGYLTTAPVTSVNGRTGAVVGLAEDSDVVHKGDLVFNVNDYGALGNGIADDTAEIQAAIDAATSAGGGIVFVPQGTYLVDPDVSIYLSEGLTFKGAGRNSVLKIKDNCDVLDNLVKVENADRVVLQDFTIDGNRANQDASDLVAVHYGVYVSTSNDCRVQNVYVHDTTGVGIHVYNSVGTVVTDCESSGNRYHGFECEQATSCTFSQNRGHNNTRHGIFISPGEVGGTGAIGNIIDGNMFDNNDSYGIALGIDAAGLSIGLTKDNVVTNNSVIYNGEYGINIFRVDDTTVTNNVVAYNGFFGIYLYRAERNQVIGNRMRNNSQASNGAYSEVLLEGSNDGQASKHNLIAHNFIYIDGANKANWGIREATSGDGPNVVTNNYVPNAGTAGRVSIQHADTRYDLISDTPLGNLSSLRTYEEGVAIAPDSALPGSSMGLDAPFGTAALRFINNNTGGNIQFVAPDGNLDIYAGGNNVASVTSDHMTLHGYKITDVDDPDNLQDAATKNYVDTSITASATPDATSSVKGKLQLAGDLAGSATSPEVKSRTTVVVGKTTGDYKVSDYTDTSTKSAFQLALEAAFTAADTVLIRNSSTPYTMKSSHQMASGKTLLGESRQKVILQMNSGRNATVIQNADQNTGFTTDVTIKHLTLDQQGSLQTGGGGIVCTGIQRWVVEDVTIMPSYRMNVLTLHQAAGTTTKTGTATFTNGSEVVTGSGTSFTTELAVGDILKTAGNRFIRVEKINSDTELITTLPFGYTTESSVSFRVIQPNSYLYFKNCEFQGTIDGADATGWGFADYSTVTDCISHGATNPGCGFVPDHARGMRFINCVAYDNDNSGFSFETCEDIYTISCNTFGNGNGYQLISGSTRCVVSDTISHDNVSHGFSTSYNITGAPVSDQNSFIDCTARDNGAAGLRIDGSHRNQVLGGRYFNNTTGGIIINVANSRIPLLNTISNVKCYDDRTTKLQAYGVRIVSGDQTKLINVEAVDNVTSNITDAGTNTAMLTMNNGFIGIANPTPANQLNVGVPITADALPKVLIAAGTGTSKGVVIQAGGSTGNLMEFQSTAGNVFANFTSGGLFRGPTGTAGAPTFSFTQDGSTGFYRPSGVANTVRFSTAANDRMQIDTNRTTFMHGMQFKRTAATLNYTIATNDYLIAYTALAAPRTVTLPTAVGVENQQYIIKDESGNAGTNNITVATTSSQTIDGASTKVINSNYGSYTFYSDGANWFVL